MIPEQDPVNQFLQSIYELPPKERDKAYISFISGILKRMSTKRIVEVRDEINRELEEDDSHPLIENAIHLINGQLELRRIAGENDWR